MEEQVGASAEKERRLSQLKGGFRTLRFEKTKPRILKYQPTNARKDRAKSLGIDTGKDEQQLITANPYQQGSAVMILRSTRIGKTSPSALHASHVSVYRTDAKCSSRWFYQ